jgi:hypothetical protein
LLSVVMVLAVALGWAAAIAALGEVVERHDGPGVPGDRWRAPVSLVDVPGLAAFPTRVARPRPPQRVAPALV